MQSLNANNLRGTSLLIALALATAVPACGDDGGGALGVNFSNEELKLDALASGTLTDVLAILDIDGDGTAGQDDIVEIERCVEEGDVARCDLDGNGEVNANDLILAKVWIGYRSPRSMGTVAATTTVLGDFIAGDHPFTGDTDMLELLSDHNGDGVLDLQDVQLVVDQLGDNPVERLDRTGDGILDFDDLQEFTRSFSLAYFGGVNAEADLSGNGIFGREDLRLLATLGQVLTESHPGFLDTNGDHEVDEEDYCLVSNHPLQRNFLNGLMLEAEATAAFDAETPKLLTCRQDGKNIARFPVRTNTEMDYIIRPSNVYLKKVTEVPAAYELGSQSNTGSASLYILTTEETSVRLREFRLAWLVAPGEDFSTNLYFDGEMPTESALLILPSATASLTNSTLRAAITVPKVNYFPYRQAEKAARTRFFQRLQQTVTAYRELIAGCPGSGMSVEDQKSALRYLVKYTHALESLEGYARFRRGLQADRHQALLTNHVGMMTASASGWDAMSQAFVYQTAAETALLIGDIAKEGNLPGALANAVGNLFTEYFPPDGGDLPVYLTGEGNMFTDLIDGIPVEMFATTLEKGIIEEGGEAGVKQVIANLLSDDSIATVLKDIVKSANAPNKTLLQQAMNKFANNLRSHTLKGLGKEGLKTILITVIKNIPKAIVNYQIRSLLESDLQAVAGAQAYAESTKRMAVWDGAVSDVVFARTTLEGLTTDLKNAMDSSVDTGPILQCATQLESDLASAESDYHFATVGDQALLDSLSTNPIADDVVFLAACHNGDSRRELDRLRTRRQVAVYALANADGNLANGIEAATETQQAFKSGIADFESKCADRLKDYNISGETVALYLDAIGNLELAQDEFEQERNTAWGAYDACEGDNPFDFSIDQLVSELPWDADAGIAALYPNLTMECCGDGVIQIDLGETCDTAEGQDVVCDGAGEICDPTACICVVPAAIAHSGVTQCWSGSPYSVLGMCPVEGAVDYGQDANFIQTLQSFSADLPGGVVTDLLTGLIWEYRDPDLFVGNHANALAYCTGLDLGGFQDWRMPNLYEALTVVDFSIAPPRRHPDFEESFGAVMRTSTTYETYIDSTKSHFAIDIYHGDITDVYQTHNDQVTCVRGGEFLYGVLQDNGDGTITDQATQLMWQQQTGEVDEASVASTWSGALGHCQAMTVAGHDDWRLPSIRELATLVQGEKQNESLNHALNETIFTTSTGTWTYMNYWTATIDEDSSGPWVIQFDNGRTRNDGGNAVRCVR